MLVSGQSSGPQTYHASARVARALCRSGPKRALRGVEHDPEVVRVLRPTPR
jgi:hypothetical protein